MKRLVALTCLALACGVPDPPPPTGGVRLGPPGGACPRGFGVVSTDYGSTSVAVLDEGGRVLSGAMLSSGSAGTGTSAALSGDVVLPRDVPTSGHLVLLDRYPNAVLTWVDVEEGRVLGQARVATGFPSNPHDYVEVGAARAYVSRYGKNPKPGREAMDAGDDVVILDTSTFSMTGRIDLEAYGEGFLARPDRMLRLGSAVLLLLGRTDAGYKTAGDGRIVGLDPATDTPAFAVDLPGVANCGGFDVSPSKHALGVSCTGLFADGAGQLGRSDVVVLDATTTPPAVQRRYAVATTLGAPVAPALAFDGETRLLGVAYGELAASRGDVLFALDLGSGEVRKLATSSRPFTFGDVRCSACTGACLFADAERGMVRRFQWNGVAYAELPEIRIDAAGGLPPRLLGGL